MIVFTIHDTVYLEKKMPEPLTKLQSALVAKAAKKHEDKKGFYLFVNINDGTHVVGRTAKDAFEHYEYWYWCPIANAPELRLYSKEMMGITLPLT